MRRFKQTFTYIFLYFTSLLIITNSSYAQKQLYSKFNFDFETIGQNNFPVGWTIQNSIKKFGYDITLSDAIKTNGKYSMKISHNGKDFFEGMYCNVFQSLDAVPYRSRKVVFSSDVYFENSDDTTKVFLWMYEHFVDGSKGKFVISEMDSSKESKWRRMSVELDADPFIDYVNVGFYLNGKGIMFVDNAKIEVISPYKTPSKSNVNLTNDNIQKLYTTTDIFSKFAFYNPKQSLYEADKFSMLYKFINLTIESQNNDYIPQIASYLKQLDSNATLSKLTKSIADKQHFSKNMTLKNIEGEAYSIVNYGATNNKKSVTAKSERKNVFASQKTKEGSLLQIINLQQYKNNLSQITISAKCKLTKLGQGTNAQIWARIDVDNEKDNVVSTMKDKPFTDSIWTEINLIIKVPQNPKALRLGLVLLGDGEALFDDIKVTAIDGASKKINLKVKNNDFQNGLSSDVFNTPKDWEQSKSLYDIGYRLNVVDDKLARSKVLKIYSDKDNYVNLPNLGQYAYVNINDSLLLSYPLNIEEDYKEITFEYPFEIIETNDKDAISRISSVIYLTSLINEFTDVKIDYKTFENAIKLVAQDKNTQNPTDERQLEYALSIIMSKIKDSGARVWNSEFEKNYSYPFSMKYIDGDVIVNHIENFSDNETENNNLKNIEVGWVIKKINNIDINQIINNLKNTVSYNNDNYLFAKVLAEIRSSDIITTDEIEFSDNKKTTQIIKIQKSKRLNEVTIPKTQPLFEIAKDVIYCDITRVPDEMFKYHLPDIKKMKAIVFDTRGIPLMSEYFLGFFTKKEFNSYKLSIPVRVNPKGNDIDIDNAINFAPKIKALTEYLDIKVYFICDEYSSGYSELILQAAKEQKIGTIFGLPTSGSNSEIATLRLPCNYLCALPVVKVYDNKNNDLTSKPVIPNIEIIINKDKLIANHKNWEETGQDLLIEYTIDYILKQIQK